jgi:hypothetical protein
MTVSRILSVFISASLKSEDVQYFDDQQGLMIFGGQEVFQSFQGYIGEATYYRGRALEASKVSNPLTSIDLFVGNSTNNR